MEPPCRVRFTSATRQNSTERDPQVTVLNDGAFMSAFCHIEDGDGGDGRGGVDLRRVNADLALEDRVVLVDDELTFFHVGALQNGDVLAAYTLYDAVQSYAQRLDAYGVPIGDPVALGSYFVRAASAPDGRLVIGGGTGNSTWIRLYDANWQPITEEFEFKTTQDSCSLNLTNVPLAYGEDGTIWIVWQGGMTGEWKTFLTTLKPLELGDANCDGVVNLFDIDPFVLAMSDPSGYEAAYPDCDRMLADTDGDGSVSNFDIDPFVATLVGG